MSVIWKAKTRIISKNFVYIANEYLTTIIAIPMILLVKNNTKGKSKLNIGFMWILFPVYSGLLNKMGGKIWFKKIGL